MSLGRILIISIYLISVTIFGLLLKYGDILSDVLYAFYPQDDKQVFDYIIVGAGSAGSIIANKLARNGIENVLLLEAGKQSPDLLRIPSVGLLLQQTSFDWKYKTVPQRNACLGLNQNISLWPMGRLLGGTSMLNNMLYVRGHEQDFNEWFKDSNDYNYEEILEYFKRVENIQSDKTTGASEGPVYVNNLIYSTSLPEILLTAAKRLGYPVVFNNFHSKLGFSVPKANLYKGKRWTSADKLKRHDKRNLSIRTNCLVEKVLFRSNFEAYGVQYNFLWKHYCAYAKKAVILSAGVIGTPKILMLSGVGRKDHLKELGIETVVNLPVGDNLQDHVTTGLDLVLLKQTLGLGIESMLSPFSALQYFFNGSGPWTTVGCEVMAFFNANNNHFNRPSLQLMVMPLGIKEDDGYYLRKLMGISDRVWQNYFSKIDKKTLTILPVLLHPKSKGTVRLASKDPSVDPLIDPQYLSDPADVEVLISGIRLVQRLLETEELKSIGAEFNKIVLPDCKKHIFDTKEYWECYVRHLTITTYHPVGTCKMGNHADPSTVVNYDFQVKGINKLYIVDGSVVPSLPSGNVNAPIMMLAELAGDTVRKIHYLSSKRCSLLDIFIRENVC